MFINLNERLTDVSLIMTPSPLEFKKKASEMDIL